MTLGGTRIRKSRRNGQSNGLTNYAPKRKKNYKQKKKMLIDFMLCGAIEKQRRYKTVPPLLEFRVWI